MGFDADKEFHKHLELAKEKGDHMALAFALEESKENKKYEKYINEFKKNPLYKKILLKSLKRFREIVKDKEKIMQNIDKDYYLESKKKLMLLEREAKKIKLKIN